MKATGITSTKVFYDWLVEEGEYLRGLCTTPPKETLESEYYLKLEALKSCQERLAKARLAWMSFEAGSRDQTALLETKRRHKQENKQKLLADVQALDSKLEV
jgi:hypothetical protein